MKRFLKIALHVGVGALAGGLGTVVATPGMPINSRTVFGAALGSISSSLFSLYTKPPKKE